MTNPLPRSQARAYGISDRRLRSHFWCRRYRGVYVPADDRTETTTYRAALTAVGHQAVLSLNPPIA